MSECWKCGKPTEDGATECQWGCSNDDGSKRSIDWNKVTTFDEMRMVLSAFGFVIERGSPAEQYLARFLKE